MKIDIPSHLSDDALVAEVTSLAGREREATAHLIAHLAELDARRLYLGAGFSSLFTYCTEVLRLSEAEAYNRIEAARAARRFPIVLDRLAEGSLNLTTVRLLASHLTDENHLELLAAASGKSRREVEELLARYSPSRMSLPRFESSRRPTDAGTAGRHCRACRRRHDRGCSRRAGCAGSSAARRGRSLRRWRRTGMQFGSRRAPRRARSYGWPRTCCDTRFRRGTPPRSSIGRSRRCSRSSPGRSSPRPTGREPAGVRPRLPVRRGEGEACGLDP